MGIIEFQHRVMQQRAPVIKTKLKNIFTGLVQEKVLEVVIHSRFQTFQKKIHKYYSLMIYQ